ncbi:hypothetical protein HF846_12535 [Clostridium cadaveris]|uniref:Uncharacterized protein n=1 Tax=Clostridium cadaveris TaxID=1529 RepID=A0A316MEP3_9CLOT|nr:hypothetical protein [Clostridium cadaveris]NME65422.1 hypothetical protein [Clostridium cadaveris]PWL55033.1 MAG: hypothetical protein DBY38_02710 [Clostridium cadaveris]UFH65797.1 hypothetical protein KQH81_04470 [Clostridium cadaveris]
MENSIDRFSQYISEQIYVELNKEKNIKLNELIEWKKELGLANSLKLDSYSMIKELLKNGVTYLDFYNRFKDRAYGIHPSRFDNKFKVNNYQRRKMIDTGFLEIAYYKEEEIYPGRIEKVPFLDAEAYFNLTKEDIEIWRADNIRGYNGKQMKMDI